MESKTNAKRMNAGMQRLIEGSSWEVVAKANFEQAGPSDETDTPSANEARNTSKAKASKKAGEQEPKTKRETDVKSKTHQESKTSTTLQVKTPEISVDKKAAEQDVKVTEVVEEIGDGVEAGAADQGAGKQEVKSPQEGNASRPAKPTKPSKKKSRKDAQLESLLKQECKNNRVIVENGQARRPVNMTLLDDNHIHLHILAAKRLVQPWKLLNEAIRRYLVEEGELKE